GVKAKLEDRLCFRFPRKLAINDLIGPRSQMTRLLNPEQDVRPALPLTSGESPLNNYFRSTCHRGSGSGGSGVLRLIRDVGNCEASCAETFYVSAFMLQAALLQYSQMRILPCGGR